jgi:hypothetical protein
MAVTLNGQTGSYLCVSSDTKPVQTDSVKIAPNQLLVELDTGLVYYWDGTKWAKFGGE